MLVNKRIKWVTGVSSIIILGLLVVLYIEEINDKWIFIDNLLWSMLGNSVLAWLVAQTTYDAECANKKRKIIIDILNIQKEVKYLEEHMPLVDNMSSALFFECYEKIAKYIDSFYIMLNIFEYEMGSSLFNNVKLEGYMEVYNEFVIINRHIYNIGKLLSETRTLEQREKVIEKLNKLWREEEKVVELIKEIFKREYGKNFAKIKSIGLI